MRTVPTSPPSTEYQPTLAQQQRAAALRRFNWLYFYLPIMLLSVGGISLLGYLLWISLSIEQTDNRIFVSALADIIVILTTLPMLLLCAIVPGTAVYLTIRGRREGQAPLRTIQILFWRLETIIGLVDGRLNRISYRIVAKLISMHSQAAWLCQLITSLTQQIKHFLRR